MRNRNYFLGALVIGFVAAATNCSSGGDNKFGPVTPSPGVPIGTGGSNGINIGSAGSSSVSVGVFANDQPLCERCDDFPSTPIIEAGAEKGPTLFAGSASGAGPCITEPEPGSLFPRNWLRPRVNVNGGSATGQFQLTFHADRETSDLVVYTTKLPWGIPKEIWTKLATNVMEEDVTVTLRESKGGSFTESKTTFRIAPVEAGGSIVFWHATSVEPGPTTSALFGFAPGDEGVIATLRPPQVKTVMYSDSGNKKQAQYGSAEGEVRCLGCHTSTPDGAAVAFNDHWPWNVAIASVEPGKTGEIPSYVTQAGRMMAQSPWQGVTTFSVADWTAGKRRYVTSFAPRTMDSSPQHSWEFWPGQESYAVTGKDDLIWVNLSAEGTIPEKNGSDIGAALVNLRGSLWDVIARTGDVHGAVTPDWSHDGTRIAYTSTDSTSDGRVGKGPKGSKEPTVCDVYTVPFANGAGGEATPLKGASDAKAAEYYPDFSPDDKFVAFNRLPATGGDIYSRKEAELYLVSSGGGEPIRLAANDPATCTSLAGNAVLNSWPKWSPVVRESKGNKYYFLTFSSARYTKTTLPPPPGGQPVPGAELYLTAVKVDSTGQVTTYPAIYMWNQNYLVTTDGSGKSAAKEELGLNVTPAWDEFVIPDVPEIPPML